ncbi:acyl carrier protein [Intestinibacillus massiliensis]|uniref:acyl carrier protein n=1 Tax=Intestinibacillus massiliensis TaxID=1871029 RepID=UPI000B35FF01|nr:acyl carrier protein [Intestinibacillus massiliensis]MCB6366937.1 acyl carrier protein [Intestinibacillus massiliensis]
MFEKICDLLAEKFDADASTMTMETTIKEDLKADSLDVVELMMDLEENFGIAISDEEAMKMSTVGDIVKYIEDHQ